MGQRNSPNFFVIGAMRGATTSLCDILALHPQVHMSRPKELNFFSNDTMFDKGFDWYRGLFIEAAGKAAIGEGSTNYTKQSLYPRAAERLAAHCPDAQLIYIVRHPLERIESHWLHLLRLGLDLPSLADALRKMPDMLDISLYWKQIAAYRARFRDERILVLFLEDLQSEPATAIRRCCEFLNLNADPDVIGARVHSNAYPDVAVDGKVLRLFRKVPGVSGLARRQPASLRGVVRKLKTPQPAVAAWPAELRAEVARQLRPDSERFLDVYGKPADFWALS